MIVVIHFHSHNTPLSDMQLLGTLDSNTTISYIDLSDNSIDDKLMSEIDAITSSRSDGRNVEGSKSPMHEVPEESDVELAKRKAIMAITRDASIPWAVSHHQIKLSVSQFHLF